MDTDEVHDDASESADIDGVGADRISVAPALANEHEADTSNNVNASTAVVAAAAISSPPSTDEHVDGDRTITAEIGVGAKADSTPTSARANDIDAPTFPPAPKANVNAAGLTAPPLIPPLLSDVATDLSDSAVVLSDADAILGEPYKMTCRQPGNKLLSTTILEYQDMYRTCRSHQDKARVRADIIGVFASTGGRMLVRSPSGRYELASNEKIAKVIKKRLGSMKERKKKNPNMARPGPKKQVAPANSHDVDTSHSASKANTDASPSSMDENEHSSDEKVAAVPSQPSMDEHTADDGANIDGDAILIEIHDFEIMIKSFVDRNIHEGMDLAVFHAIMTSCTCTYANFWRFIPDKEHPSNSEFRRVYREGIAYAREMSNLFEMFMKKKKKRQGATAVHVSLSMYYISRPNKIM